MTAPLARRLLGRPESHARAIAKALSWRLVGSLDTFGWSWLITGHAGAAGTIASLETFTKIALFYVHERLWRLWPWAPNARLRSMLKAVSWRFVGSIDTFSLSVLITRNLAQAASIASAEVATKLVLYYVHERIWRRVPWGRLDVAPAVS